jgi:regulator of sirC expression with transglutaminase-like and TPR domain
MNNEDKIRKMEALISMIDEPDPVVFADISRSIGNFGTEIIPFLEQAWENQPLPPLQKRLEDIIHTIQYQRVCEDLETWIENGATDLLEGCLILARYQYPNLKEHEIEYELAKIRKDAWLELNENLTALEQIRIFNYVFFEMHGFHGNIEKYHSPENSFINKVLESKSGNPLTLSIVYMLVAQSLDLPVKGVNLPEHFVLAYTGASINPDTLEYKGNNVLFYINVFSRGTVFSYKDIELFLKQLNQEPKPAFFNPCSNTDIFLRMINNLIIAYQKANDTTKLKEVKHIATLFENQLKKMDFE